MPQRLSRSEFHQWTAAQTRGRFERVNGEVVAMSPERSIHARLKARIWRALDREITGSGLPCEAMPDGMTVEIDQDTDYEPDALVNCAGPASDFSRIGQPLLRGLLADGRLRPDPLRLGLDVAANLGIIDATGAVSDRLFAVGPVTRGRFWEVTAVPEIRRQCEALAEHLAARFGPADG